MTGYAKPWTSYADQLRILQQRGMQVSDAAKALEYLGRIGYYRLSGYWHDMRQWQRDANGQRVVLDQFKPGTQFQDVVALYVFDKRLRLLVLDALERIEIALRVDLSYRLGQKGPFAYLDPANFSDNFAFVRDPATGRTAHETWLSRQEKLVKGSREIFVHHNHDKYGDRLAVWVACEVWDFGCTSILFSGLQASDQDEIARAYSLPWNGGSVLASWLHSFNYLRNVCAHHSRLWNRNVTRLPKLPLHGHDPRIDLLRPHLKKRPFVLLCLCHCMMQQINPSSSWSRRLIDLLEAFPDLAHLGLTLSGMGIPREWLAAHKAGGEPVWKRMFSLQ